MSNISDIGGVNNIPVTGSWTCQYDGEQFNDENVYSQHMLMYHGVVVPIAGYTPVVTPTNIPPAPTPTYQPPGVTIYPNPVNTDPRPVVIPLPVDPYVSFTPVEPVYTPAPLVPTYTPTTPAPQITGSFSVGAMLLLLGGVLAIGHRPRRKRVKRG